jgi:hypothetical protein
VPSLHASIAAALLLTASLARGCPTADGDDTASSGRTTVEVGPAQDDVAAPHLVLGVGETARPEGSPLEIRFERVVEDSRCAIGVTCVWAGRAVVEVAGSLAGSEAPERTLGLEVGGEPAELYGWRISAVGLEPAPRADQPAAADRARLEIAVEPDDR